MENIENEVLTKKKELLSDILKKIYGSSSVGLKHEYSGSGGIYGQYSSIKKEKIIVGGGNRFYDLFRYTFTNKTAQYHPDYKIKTFDKGAIFSRAFSKLKDIFDLDDSLIPKINYGTKKEEFERIGGNLFDCYSVVLDMIYKDNGLDIKRYRPKIEEILSSDLDNKPQKSQNDDYEKRQEAFMNSIIDINEKNFYKSGSLRNYLDIKMYADSKNIEIVDLNSESVTKFEDNKVYRYCCECFFAVVDGYDGYIRVSINLNGKEIGAMTSEKNWLNSSLLSNYAYDGLSRFCVCYFKYDQNRVFQFLQIGDE